MPSADRWSGCGGIFDYDAARARLDELSLLAEDPAFWNDPAAAQSVMRERTRLEGRLVRIDEITQDLNDNLTLIELGEAEEDEAVIAEAEAALTRLQKAADRAEDATAKPATASPR